MEANYPPRVLVKTWVQLIESPDVTEIRRNLIEANIERIFGSVELAEMYFNEQTTTMYDQETN